MAFYVQNSGARSGTSGARTSSSGAKSRSRQCGSSIGAFSDLWYPVDENSCASKALVWYLWPPDQPGPPGKICPGISGIQWTKTLVLQRYLWPPDQPGPPGKICPGTKILGLFLFLTATPNTKYTLIMILQQLQIERWHHTLHLGCDHHD